MTSTWTAANVPDQSGRVAVVTGANTGIGYEAAQVLAGKGARVVIAVRNLDKGKDAVDRITALHPGADVSLQELDLSSLASIRGAAAELRAAHPRLDLLVNNAGVMYPPKQTTADGFELQFGTNHLGHFALTGLLLDTLLDVPGSRVVTVASMAHRNMADIHFDDLNWEHKYNRVAAYGQSKLANLMFTYELQRRLAGRGAPTVAVAAHPGISNTELMRHIPGTGLPGVMTLAGLITNSPRVGALATLRAATDPEVRGGQYYGPSGFREMVGHPVLVDSNAKSHDVAVAQRLWTVSEDLTGVKYPI
ncbi:SDR family NAD(P)-dependent oxidoreductase [Mycolicibacterium parafortuitum]|nr:SDR family NAD(P)-dependent oxidoreductase [Mycolicibacterium parafortuitum]ORB31396.1 short-chain dehydrogenase [Mycolicibacterium parafortuitum]